MTALSEYERLEASGLWRPGPDQQRRDVIVSIGNATLIISDTNDVALTHWSLSAVTRANPGKRPAIFYPAGDPGETLELADSEVEMIAAIAKLQAAIERGRPHPGRLRLVAFLTSVAAVVALAVFWLPGALLTHTVTVVPAAKRHEIGESLLSQTYRLTGKPCSSTLANPALARLGDRFGIIDLKVVTSGVRTTLSLPGGVMLVHRSLLEQQEGPDVVAGYIIAEIERLRRLRPLRRFLDQAGTLAVLKLLTTGAINEDDARTHIERVIAAEPAEIDADALLRAFAARGVRSTPYAYAVDPSGETTLGLIEADPFAGTETEPVLTDSDWVALQGICEGN